MTRNQLNIYYERKKKNLELALKFIRHSFKIHPLDDLTIVIKCTEKEHSDYCAKLSCSGYYNKKLGDGQLLNFFEYK